MTSKFKDKLNKSLDSIIIKEDTIPKILLKAIEHNKDHYITLEIFGNKYYPCARCLGLWTGIFTGFFLSSPFWLGIYHANNFFLVFTIAWLFAFPSILDWVTVKLKLRKGNDKLRVVVGFLHGLGINIYIFILPANIIFKILSYLGYEVAFFEIRQRYRSKRYNTKSKK